MQTFDNHAGLVAKRLRTLAESLSEDYAQGDPFPHIVIDDFLPEEILDRVLAEFPDNDDEMWDRKSKRSSVKLSCNNRDVLGLETGLLIDQLNAPKMLDFLARLTGIEDLIPDVHLFGGGLHQILSGGFLKIHADFNKHPAWHLDRRLNVLLFLNRDWREEFGGHFELWDEEMLGCRKRVLPIFNRLVVFTTTDTSFHGHPDPLQCPTGQSRKSIALYYYTNGRADETAGESHSTIYKIRSGQDKPQRRLSRAARGLLKPLSSIVGRLRQGA